MRNNLFAGMLLLLAATLISAGTVFYRKSTSIETIIKKDIIACGYESDDATADENGKFIPLLPGLRQHTYTISTNSDSAQVYFDQGLNFYYSYHTTEALASFKEAARFDKSCAMAYWGQALALGPYYNSYEYKMPKSVPAALALMNSNISTVTEKEKELIKAMQQRYSLDTTNADRPYLDSSYSAALFALRNQFPNDTDIKALYIDAVMLRHKWDFWHNDGNPKPWTPELVKLCEEILSTDPANPAALHYYIHVTEASKHPEVALRSADVLKDVMPGAAHMVHMATHEYQRNGLFAKGVYVNEEANAVANRVDSIAPVLRLGKDKSVHIFHVQSYCAMNAGMYAKGMPVYLRARKRVLQINPSLQAPAFTKSVYAQSIYMMPVMAQVRMGKWQEILGSPAPEPSWRYTTLLDAFARGLAYVNTKNLSAAKKSLSTLEAILPDSLLNVRSMPFNKPVQCGNIAAGILKGEVLYAEGKQSEAIAAFKRAVAEEDNLIYSEPQAWLLPARQYLGYYLLKMNKAKEAETVYREDLKWNPGNGWSLLGIYNSLLAQKKTTEAAKYKTMYTSAFHDADVNPVASVF
jgi:tetratricopeptide (TPR) repeat protein